MRLRKGYLLILLTAACFSCRSRSGSDSLKVIALRGPSAVEMVPLMDCPERCGGRTIEISILDEPMQARQAILRGNADFAVLPTTMAALLYNRGGDIRLAAVPIWGSLHICGKDTTIRSLNDLRGRTIHVMARGTNPDIFLRYLLSSSGLEVGKDVRLDYRFPTHIDLSNAAMAGLSDLCVLPEPYLSLVIRANADLHHLVDLSREWLSSEGTALPETALLCKGSLAEGSDKTVSRVIEALDRSALWVKAHPDSAAALACKYGINPDTSAVKASIARCDFRVVPAADAETEINHYLRAFLRDSGEAIGGRMPDEKFIVR